MPARVCETCLTKDAVLVVCLGDERCRRCGKQPEVRLTFNEIRECVKK